MGDDDQCQPGIPCSEPGDRAVDLLFGTAVERRGRLVEEKHVGLPVERTGYADALALSAREAAAALPDVGVDPFRQPGDQLPELCRAERLHDPLPVDLPGGDAQRDVGREAAVGDEKVLRDVPDAVLPCPAVGRRKWRAVDGDFTPARLVQPQQQVEERRFPGARGSADTDALALADRQRKAVKKLAPAVREAEPKVAHGDLVPERQLFGGAGGIGGGVPGIAGFAGAGGQSAAASRRMPIV